MTKQVLITGGAGFVGSHVADELLAAGFGVRALDNLSPQIHGAYEARPPYLDPDIELLVGDIRDATVVRRALKGVDAVIHLAAMVGVGQSMYEIERYTSVNNLGTAVLLEALIDRPVERLVVASSMSIYGEGLYRRRTGAVMPGRDRTVEQLKARDWEVRSEDGEPLIPAPTPEWKTPSIGSVYALSKYDQERMCMVVGRAYQIPTVALRFFNIYGPRQALSNPYTGVLAIFASRYLNHRPPLINEDGLQLRDFVSARDVAQACRLALNAEAAPGQVFNIGSGQPYTILGLAERMAAVLGMENIYPRITGKYRMGDIRHCTADISLARRVLGYQPRVSLENGLIELASWLEGQPAVDHVEQAQAELASRGLTV